MAVPEVLRIVEYRNPRMIGDYTSFALGEYDDPKLKELREKYKLEEVIRSGKTELEKLILLRRWVKSRWKHGFSGWYEVKTDKPLDALALLAEAEKGKNFACGHYARTYVECCQSLGYQARYVGILRDRCDVEDENVGHAVTEVWSNDFSKWVIMDPDLNVHYERDGVPLNALEIRQAWLKGEVDKVKQVKAEPPFEMVWDGKVPKEKVKKWKKDIEQFVANKTMHEYEYIVIPIRDVYSEKVKDLKPKTYMLGDKVRGPILFYIRRELEKTWPDIEFTTNPDDMYFSINQTFIDLRAKNLEKEPATLEVKLRNNMPNFDRYDVRLDGGQWKTKPEQFEWKLNPGMNTIEAKAVNKLDRPGIQSKITVEYKP